MDILIRGLLKCIMNTFVPHGVKINTYSLKGLPKKGEMDRYANIQVVFQILTKPTLLHAWHPPLKYQSEIDVRR